jgi:hypothetical protein
VNVCTQGAKSLSFLGFESLVAVESRSRSRSTTYRDACASQLIHRP